jgi:hypothetical protein
LQSSSHFFCSCRNCCVLLWRSTYLELEWPDFFVDAARMVSRIIGAVGGMCRFLSLSILIFDLITRVLAHTIGIEVRLFDKLLE